MYKADARSRRKAARKQGQGQGQRAGSDERKPRTGDTSVMASIPPEVVYFFRTIDMLQGLCTRLEVSYP